MIPKILVMCSIFMLIVVIAKRTVKKLKEVDKEELKEAVEEKKEEIQLNDKLAKDIKKINLKNADKNKKEVDKFVS